MIAALHKTTPEARREAIGQLEAGKSISRKSLVQLELKDKEVAAREQLKKRNRLLAAQITRRAQAELASYRAELNEYVEELIDFHEIDQLEDALLDLKILALSARAEQLLSQFHELFGS